MTEHICDGQWRYYCEACSGLPEAGEQSMTDQDNLRDRIEDTIEAAYAQWEFEFEAHEDGNRAYVDPGPKDAFIAQAIIDELGLTVEECPCVFGCKETRAVGKWEKQ